jgi:hypothetical protein
LNCPEIVKMSLDGQRQQWILVIIKVLCVCVGLEFELAKEAWNGCFFNRCDNTSVI